MSNINLQKLS